MTSSEATSPGTVQGDSRPIRFDVLALLLLVFLTHFTRLSVLPVLGEEGRRARNAINMIETGDWIVVQNQGVVYPDRPPMTSWLMVLLGVARGSVDIFAIRLPSALAVLLTALLLYWYCRRLGSRLEALVAPAVFVTFGQVLQLGRLGESEAAFVLFVSASLLFWHLGFAKGWSPALAWSAGYGLAALGALTKGPQAPIYFVAATGLFLLWRREWRWLFGRGQWIGAGVFLIIVLAWQIPHYLATDWSSVVDIWFGNVGPRLNLHTLASHVATYPLEILGSLLPWSPLLMLVGSPAICRALWARDLPRRSSRAAFLLVSLAVTFPTVWLSAGARTRYYMPLYPLIAVLIAMILAHCATSPEGSPGRRIWRRIMNTTVVGVLLLVAILVCALVLDGPVSSFRPPNTYVVAILLAGFAAIAVALTSRSSTKPRSASAAVLLAAAFAGLFYSGPVVSQLAERRQDVRPAVAELRSRIPQPERLVSFGPIHAKFLYLWGDFVPEVPWPKSIDGLPPEVDYFGFHRQPAGAIPAPGLSPPVVPPGSRVVVRGTKVWTTPSVLPFEWRLIGVVDCGRKPMDPPDVEVVVGQVIRDLEGRPVPSRQ